MQKNEEEINIRLVLTNELGERFLALKKKLGFKTNKSTMIHLINTAYDRAVSPES
ncbi:MAG: hypothetical protein OEZ48_00240 [Candidatus Bathyarchaeota archaeon]|nr:hypothetical protein [Candidatus Bathyarchaeota archaeon]MDH5686285.1 hypothetical protein [Candidatus Bathyarchaeota archaeon]